MNRMLRNSVAFLLGVFIAFCSVRAETIPATSGTETPVQVFRGRSSIYLNRDDACRSFILDLGSGYFYDYAVTMSGPFDQCFGHTSSVPAPVNMANVDIGWRCPSLPADNILFQRQPRSCQTVSYSCPANQNWTLTGTTCTRPDCVDGQQRQPDGTCGEPKCKSGDTSTATYYTGQFYVGQNAVNVVGTKAPTPTTLCDGQCVGSVNTITDCVAATSATPQNPKPVICTAPITLNGSQCTGDNGAPPTPPTVPSNTPPCAPGQGVIEAAGTVKCVDPNQVDKTTNPPVINKTTSTQTHPDGSQVINNTIQTCTGQGACSTSTTTTITPSTAGGPGTAGQPGTSTKLLDKGSEPTSDFCAQNPNLQICKGGMATEAVQKETLDEIKKFNNPTASDDSAISSKTFESTPGRSDLTTHDDSLKNYVIGAVVPGEVVASKGAWETAMSSGWFDPIERGGCQPYVATIAGRTWTWDYCQKAEDISRIGAYCLWVSLAFGLFVMLTGGQRS